MTRPTARTVASGDASAKKKRGRPPSLAKRLNELVQLMVGKGIRLEEAQHQLERLFLIELLRTCDGNQCRAAEQMGMHRNTLRRKLHKHDLL